MKPRAFTLLEMLLATAMMALLLGAVLGASTALSRDARRLEARVDFPRAEAAFDLIRRDLVNATSITPSRDGTELVLIGHGGIDAQTLRSNPRLTRVTYRIQRGLGLVREQQYLDDRAHPARWQDLVVAGARQIEAFETRGGMELRIELPGGKSIDRVLMVR